MHVFGIHVTRKYLREALNKQSVIDKMEFKKRSTFSEVLLNLYLVSSTHDFPFTFSPGS